MTETEKILNLLEMNGNTPSMVVDENQNIIACNMEWSDRFGSPEIGKSMFNLFDKSSSTLIKNSLIDAKTFDKIQRRQITFETEEKIIERNLIISPFKLSQKLYFYILIYSDFPARGKIFVYPSSDDNELRTKYASFFEKIKNALPQTLVERKNFQQLINNENVPIAVSYQHDILFSNTAFDIYVKSDGENITNIKYKDIFETDLLEKIISAETEAILNKNTFILEQIDENSSQNRNDIIIISPEVDNNNQVFAVILFIIKKDISKTAEFEKNQSSDTLSENERNLIEKDLDSSDHPQLIYDKNDYNILHANKRAVELYGYNAEKFKNLNITQLFPPEDMQKLLTLPDMDNKEIVKQIFYDGSINELELKVENISWKNKEAYLATITTESQFEEEVIDIDERESEKEVSERSKEVSERSKAVESYLEDENISNFLSNLFHEILTPVNVILGFVQEIIDSLDDLSEEQSESAHIIKDNQQVLLQTMNTAVQFAQLAEKKINISLDRFDFNNSLVDLHDGIAQISSQKNLDIEFDESSESLNIYHDRSKLIFAISYFIRFIAKITDSQKIYISARIIGNEFIVLVKDNEYGISEDLALHILKIFDSSETNKNDFGISLIAIKLAIKLNELLHADVREYVDSEGIKQIAFITTADYNLIEKSAPLEPEIKESPSSETVPAAEAQTIVIEEIGKSESIPELPPEDVPAIKNGDVDEKIIEDIEEEKEIVTEEIASVGNAVDNSFNLSNYSCLFIDDNLDAQLLFKSQIKELKLLKVSSNLTEALPLLNKYNFDFIFVDLNLNDAYNGFDALKIIRQFSNYSATPIIAITAYPFEGDRQKFIEFGFSDYLVKPLLRDHILNVLKVIAS